MPLSHDTILLETVRTRRARLQSALVYGGLTERRAVTDNVKRLIGSLVVAAVACAGCVGFAVIAGILATKGAGFGAGTGPAPTRPAATSPTPPVPSGQSTGDRR